MAVASGDFRSMSPSYAQLFNALEQQSKLELAKPQDTSILTAGAKTLNDALLQQRDFRTKLTLAGRKMFTAEMATELESDIGLQPGTLTPLVGTATTPQDVENEITFRLGLKSQKEYEESLPALFKDNPELIALAKTKVGMEAISKQKFPNSTGNKFRYLRDTEKGITYQYDESTGQMIPLIGSKSSGVKKSLDDLEKDDRKEIVQIKTQFQPVFRKTNETISAANIVLKALEAKNPILDVGMRVRLAKIFGDTGNIAVVEQAQYGGSPALLSQAQNIISRKLEGVVSDENRKYLIDAVRVLKRGSQEEQKSRIKEQTSIMKDVYNIDDNFAYRYLTGKKSPDERYSELEKEGKKEDEIYKILLSEGY